MKYWKKYLKESSERTNKGVLGIFLERISGGTLGQSFKREIFRGISKNSTKKFIQHFSKTFLRLI